VPSNVVQLAAGPRCRVLIAHQSKTTRRVLRSVIKSEGMALVEVADGESALAELAIARFDLLILELDLPEYDGLTVMKLHRILMANQPGRAEPPAVVFTLAREVRGNPVLTEHLQSLGVSGFIDDTPGDEVSGMVNDILRARECRATEGKKPAAA